VDRIGRFGPSVYALTCWNCGKAAGFNRLILSTRRSGPRRRQSLGERCQSLANRLLRLRAYGSARNGLLIAEGSECEFAPRRAGMAVRLVKLERPSCRGVQRGVPCAASSAAQGLRATVA
jgi:hypothetical protein